MGEERPSPSELFEFADDILTRLPREIRNIVYTHIFDDATLNQVAACSQPSLNKFPYNNLSSTRVQRPAFIEPGRVPREIAVEIIQQFYLSYKSMEVFKPKSIGNYLKTDFFGLGIKPINVPLSAFTISADLDASAVDGIDSWTVANDCKPVLEKANQNWKAFRLNITLTSRIGFFFWRTPDHVERLTKKLLAVLSALKLVVRAAEKKGAKVTIKVESYDGWDMQARVNMDKDKEWWRRRVNRLMVGSQINDAGIEVTMLRREAADADADD
ncbi:hypothetical protein BDV96DRAFT_286609 [Lophiotrema nucula]|uniref:Uncharacterized protein n=1 Tax=Lophiotrema nucula TaxID=690887 RepID=A0A6A5YL55_9PLEO|nr:hypothetical protein BDV96DRAFT_286609 [Lophiotrema nucula]